MENSESTFIDEFEFKQDNHNKLINYNKKLLYFIIVFILISTIFNVIILVYILPSRLDNFDRKIDNIDEFEKNVNIMENKFNKIYEIVMNFCEVFILKKICYKNTNTSI